MDDVWPQGAVIAMGPLRVRVEGEVTSTHEELWARRRWVEPGTGVAAESQTAGIGRSGTRWASPPGGLYVSVMAGAGMPAADLDALGEAASIAALETALETVPAADVYVKWPNDVFVVAPRGRVGKIAGVIVRAETGADRVERAVVSVGLNIGAGVESARVPPTPMVVASLEGVARSVGSPWEATRAQVLEWLVGFLALHLERARVDPAAVRQRYGEELRRAPLRARVAGVREVFRPVGVVRGGGLQVRRESGRAAEVSVEDAERLEWRVPRPPARGRPKARASKPKKARKPSAAKRAPQKKEKKAKKAKKAKRAPARKARAKPKPKPKRATRAGGRRGGSSGGRR